MEGIKPRFQAGQQVWILAFSFGAATRSKYIVIPAKIVSSPVGLYTVECEHRCKEYNETVVFDNKYDPMRKLMEMELNA